MGKVISLMERQQRDLRQATDEAIISLSEIVRLSDEIGCAEPYGPEAMLRLRAEFIGEAIRVLRADMNVSDDGLPPTAA